MPLTRPCVVCGVDFTGRRERKACSRECGIAVRTKPPRPCAACGDPCDPRFPQSKFCSKKCVWVVRREVYPPKPKASNVHFLDCIVCGKAFCTRTRKRVACSAECRRRRNLLSLQNKYHSDPDKRARNISAAHARRADKLGLGSAPILISYLIQRDGGRCQIPNCHFSSRKVSPPGTGPRAASIDHITPLSKGGAHQLYNVQLAHTRCNLSKNNRGTGDQLALIG